MNLKRQRVGGSDVIEHKGVVSDVFTLAHNISLQWKNHRNFCSGAACAAENRHSLSGGTDI
jgi:hypothetical protein